MAGRGVKINISKTYGALDLARDLDVSRETLARFEIHADQLRRWQARINLVGPDTLDDFWRRHFLDSAQLFRLLPGAYDALYDIGSGAGFPGLVLSIMGAPNVHLIESDQRKAAFLREAVRATGATATVHAGRVEGIVALPGRTVIAARAVAPLESLLTQVRPLIGPGTVCLFHKGAQAAAEIEKAQARWSMRLETIPSLSDARGVILRIEELAHD